MEISLLLSAAQSASTSDLPSPPPRSYLSSSTVSSRDASSAALLPFGIKDDHANRVPENNAAMTPAPRPSYSTEPPTSTSDGRIEKKAVKPFRCTYEGCEATFGQKGSLTRHIKSRHEKLRPHTCDVCQKSFSALWTLRVHQRNVHLKSKPHKCHLCDKSFGELFNKSKHIAIVHEGKRPFSCPICSRAFGYKGDMRKHVMELHEQSGRPFQCMVPSCGVKFARKRYLRRHENLSHKGNTALSNREATSSAETSPNLSYSNAAVTSISFLSSPRPSSYFMGRPAPNVAPPPLPPPPQHYGSPSGTQRTKGENRYGSEGILRN